MVYKRFFLTYKINNNIITTTTAASNNDEDWQVCDLLEEELSYMRFRKILRCKNKKYSQIFHFTRFILIDEYLNMTFHKNLSFLYEIKHFNSNIICCPILHNTGTIIFIANNITKFLVLIDVI